MIDDIRKVPYGSGIKLFHTQKPTKRLEILQSEILLNNDLNLSYLKLIYSPLFHVHNNEAKSVKKINSNKSKFIAII